MNRPIGIDLFCGVGGMSLGFEQAGFDVVAAFDADERVVGQHKVNFPECVSVQMDLSVATGADLREKAHLGSRKIDVVFGGPPCQAFSTIGKRETDDARRNLLLRFATLTVELRPDYFVLENVTGLLAPEFHELLADTLAVFRSGGYSIVEPLQELNAAQFGVPQLRKRVFICGWRDGLTPLEYPVPSEDQPPTVEDAIADLTNIGSLTSNVFQGALPDIRATNLYAAYLRGTVQDPHDRSGRPRTTVSELTGCKVSFHTTDVAKRFSETEPGRSETVSRYFRLASSGLANTTRAGTDRTRGSHTAARQIHPLHARCITVREAARLHSFPDWFEFDDTIWHGFRQVGNSVPPLLARRVAAEVMRAWVANASSRAFPELSSGTGAAD